MLFQRFELFRLSPSHFPENTRKLFPTTYLLEHGVLPLGFKNRSAFFKNEKLLNLGFLNPKESARIKLIEKKCREVLGEKEFKKIQVFRIQIEDFVETLDIVYHVDRNALLKIQNNAIHPSLERYLRESPQI